jgi:hypothetical protein
MSACCRATASASSTPSEGREALPRAKRLFNSREQPPNAARLPKMKRTPDSSLGSRSGNVVSPHPR